MHKNYAFMHKNDAFLHKNEKDRLQKGLKNEIDKIYLEDKTNFGLLNN